MKIILIFLVPLTLRPCISTSLPFSLFILYHLFWRYVNRLRGFLW